MKYSGHLASYLSSSLEESESDDSCLDFFSFLDDLPDLARLFFLPESLNFKKVDDNHNHRWSNLFDFSSVSLLESLAFCFLLVAVSDLSPGGVTAGLFSAPF